LVKESFLSRIGNFLKSATKNTSEYADYAPDGQPGLNVYKVRDAINMFSTPVFGPEVTGLGAYAREGYSSKAFEIPVVGFREQVKAMEIDEDVNLALNTMTAQITGGKHYWRSNFEQMVEYMGKFSHDIDFDWMDTILVKELTGYGNSVWKPRLGIEYIRGKEDIMHLPISSFQRIWWDRQRRPYRLEFRGPEYQGYHDPYQIMHFIWNPVDASAFGIGLITALTAVRDFTDIEPNGPVDKQRPSLLDMKLSTQLTMHLTEKRYVPRNVYNALDSDETDRAAMRTALAALQVGQDFVTGKKVEVQELGSSTRAFDPTKHTDTVLGPIMKALNNFRGKQAQESSHQYANAKTAAVLDDIGMSSFPQAIQRQLQDHLFQPWYEGNPIYIQEYGGGLVSLPWVDAEMILEFGALEKKDMEPKDFASMIESAVTTGAVFDIVEKRELYEKAGLPLSKDFTDQAKQMANTMSMDPMMNMDPNMMDWSTAQADQSARPQDYPQFQGTEPKTPIQETIDDKIKREKLEILKRMKKKYA